MERPTFLTRPRSSLQTDPTGLVSNLMVENDRLTRAFRKSLRQGGTMVRVFPLAILGVSPTRISDALSISYGKVASCEKLLRRKGWIPDSARQRTRRLKEALKNPPEDFEIRQIALDSATFNFYRSNRELFRSISECLRQTNSYSVGFGTEEAVVYLRDHHVAAKVFRFPDGRRYSIVLASESAKAAKLLESTAKV